MHISVFYHHVLKACESSPQSLPELLLQLRTCGVDGVYPDLNTLLIDYNGTMKQLNDAGLRICGMCETFHWEHGFSETDVRTFVDTAEQCGTDNILVVPGFLAKEEADVLRKIESPADVAAFMEQNHSVQSIRKALQFTVDYAKTKGITVSLEDYDGWTAPYSRLVELQWWMEAVPGLGFTLDTGNFAFSDEDTFDACYRMRDHIVHVHCKDRGENTSALPGSFNRGLLPCAVGDGYMPIEKCIAYLKETGYTGGLTIEHYNVSDYKEAILRSANYLNGLK